MKFRVALITVFAVLLVLTVQGCKKPPVVVEQPEPVQTAPEPEPAPVVVTPPPPIEVPMTVEIEEPTIDQLNSEGHLQTVYFAYDQDDLTNEARGTLQGNASWLKSNAGYRIVVEGHCDERGTIEYNLNLGQRRAKTVRDYLSSLGVRSDTIRIVTYGEERPADAGNNEASWSKNRRAESKFESKI